MVFKPRATFLDTYRAAIFSRARENRWSSVIPDCVIQGIYAQNSRIPTPQGYINARIRKQYTWTCQLWWVSAWIRAINHRHSSVTTRHKGPRHVEKTGQASRALSDFSFAGYGCSACGQDSHKRGSKAAAQAGGSYFWLVVLSIGVHLWLRNEPVGTKPYHWWNIWSRCGRRLRRKPYTTDSSSTIDFRKYIENMTWKTLRDLPTFALHIEPIFHHLRDKRAKWAQVQRSRARSIKNVEFHPESTCSSFEWWKYTNRANENHSLFGD